MTVALRVLIIEPWSANHWHYTASLAGALARHGLEVRLASVAPFEIGNAPEGIPILVIDRGVEDTSSRSRDAFRRVIRHVVKIASIVRMVRGFRPHVVHLTGGLGKLDFAYLKLLECFGARIVYTAHDVSSLRWLDISNLLRYRVADLLVVHSSNSVARLRDRYGIDRSKILDIPHASPLPLVGDEAVPQAVARAVIGLARESRVILFFGDISARKGLDILLDSLAPICREHSHIFLIVAGQPQGDFGSYWKRIVEHGLSDRVILDLRHVPLERVRLYFSAADVVALPYRNAYQSHVLQWAYAFGRPVVATDVGGVREAVSADGTGIIVRVGDRDALAQALLTLLTDERVKREMGDRARRMAMTKYSWGAVSERLVNAYRCLVGET
jgi:glycosyltransferase involved in cell wall biosynthesis